MRIRTPNKLEFDDDEDLIRERVCRVTPDFWAECEQSTRIYYPGKPIPQEMWLRYVDQEDDFVYVLGYMVESPNGTVEIVPFVGLGYSRHENLEEALHRLGLDDTEDAVRSFQLGVTNGAVDEITTVSAYTKYDEKLAHEIVALCPFFSTDVAFNRFINYLSDLDDPFGFEKILGSPNITLKTVNPKASPDTELYEIEEHYKVKQPMVFTRVRCFDCLIL